MRDASSEPHRLVEILDAVGRGLGFARPVETGRLWRAWGEVVGDAVATHTEPTSLRDRVLRVRADSPTWAAEVGYLREEIRRRANAFLGDEVIDEVRVWTGPGRPRRQKDGLRREGARPDLRPVATHPAEAFERARRAWGKRFSRGG